MRGSRGAATAARESSAKSAARYKEYRERESKARPCGIIFVAALPSRCRRVAVANLLRCRFYACPSRIFPRRERGLDKFTILALPTTYPLLCLEYPLSFWPNYLCLVDTITQMASFSTSTPPSAPARDILCRSVRSIGFPTGP